MHYELTRKGKALIKMLNQEYIKAYKEGFTDEQAEDIALARVRQHER